jgi:hypothetical protein
VFRHELALILGPNQLSIAGIWDGFDPEQVCERARKAQGKRGLLARFLAALGRWA